ncbi:MAG: Gfo/Idh/MocA family oxidoreductase [Verrucomicrobiota bacterium]
MNYAPKGKPAPVCGPGEFVFAATALDHGHIYGQCNGLVEAGGDLRYVFDPDPEKVKAFQKSFPQAKAAGSLDEIFQDADVRLVAAAAVPNLRGPLGCRVMDAGRDYFTDKTPFTTLAQLECARETALRTGKKYMVYYSERLHVECAVLAGQLVADGVIGRVIQTMGTGPHRLNAPSRPAWFFEFEKYGGILCDIGSHQCEQFLHFTGAKDARVNFSAVANYGNPGHPELEDFGEASFTADNGASGYFRCDWFTPDGLRTWGDGRTIILGTEGFIELRKYTNLASEQPGGDHLFLVNNKGEQYIPCAGKVGYPFFGQLILDCLNRTENAMTQAHAFKAAELCLKAQERAVHLV